MNQIPDIQTSQENANFTHCMTCGKVFRTFGDLRDPSACVCPDCQTAPAPQMSPSRHVYTRPERQKIGGWLYLIGIGLFIGVISAFISAAGAGANGAYFEAAFSMIDIVIYGSLITLFLMKHRWFPKLYIGCAIFVLSIGLLAFVTASAPEFTPDQLFEIRADFFRSLLACAIWIPYMLVSKRVKSTFY